MGAFAMAGMAIGGGLLDVMQQQEQAEAEQEVLASQANMAREQAADEVARSEREAEVTEIQAIETARRQRLEDKKRLKSERARMAGSGVSLTEGTPLLIEEESNINSMLNMQDIFNQGLNTGAEIRYAGKQTERGLLFEAGQYDYQRQLSKQSAKNKLTTGLIKTAVGGVGAYKGFSASPKTVAKGGK